METAQAPLTGPQHRRKLIARVYYPYRVFFWRTIPLTINTRAEFLELRLAQLQWQIANADKKLATFFTLNTAMLGVMASLAPLVKEAGVLMVVFLFSTTVILIISIAMLALAAFPHVKGGRGSLIFFGGIRQFDSAGYLAAVKELDEEKYLADLAEQCHSVAQIALEKYFWIKRAATAMFTAVLPWLVTVYFLFKAKL